ncbi:hypothetical protein [Roseovarius sp.]|uniref:hypothetical protein n=1 Tax=Roseovarius sp. TaxID=1486281 RepID=UPI00261A0233|nr:hypothetical protein [Roseovarius sp.]
MGLIITFIVFFVTGALAGDANGKEPFAAAILLGTVVVVSLRLHQGTSERYGLAAGITGIAGFFVGMWASV